MPSSAVQLQEKIDKLETNMSRFDSVINGDVGASIPLDTGSVPSIKELMSRVGTVAADYGFTTRAALFANLTPNNAEVALVNKDPTIAYNGIYVKVGATGTGSWTQLVDFVPGSQFVRALATGGTVNAIVATPNIDVYPSGGQLIMLTTVGVNTLSPVTVSFGGSALTIKTAGGENIPIGGMPASTYIGTISGSDFILSSTTAVSEVATGNSARAYLDAETGFTFDFVKDLVAVRSVTDPSQNRITALGAIVGVTRSTSKYVIAEDGSLTSIGINTFAREFYGQGKRPVGLSVKRSSQSKLDFSNGNGNRTTANLTLTPNAGLAPDGVNDATLIVPTSSGVDVAHNYYPTASNIAAAGADRVFECYIKRDTGSLANVRLSSSYVSGPTEAVFIDINLTTGKVVKVGGGVAKWGRPKRLKDGWWRLWFSHPSSLVNMQPSIGILGSNMELAHQQTGGLLVAFNRADAGRTPVYPVKSNTNLVFPTTGADRPVISLAGLPQIKGNCGTITCIASEGEDSVDYGHVLFQIGPDTNCLRVTNGKAFVGGLRAEMISSSSQVFVTDWAPGHAANERFKVAVSLSDTEVVLSANGREIARVSATLPATVYDNLYIGHKADGTSQWGGELFERFGFTPRALSLTEIWGAEFTTADYNTVLVGGGHSNSLGRTGGDITPDPNIMAWDYVNLRWNIACLDYYPFPGGSGSPYGYNSFLFHEGKRVLKKNGGKVWLILRGKISCPIRKFVKDGERPMWDLLNGDIVAALAAANLTKIHAYTHVGGDTDANVYRFAGTFGSGDNNNRSEHGSEHLYIDAMNSLTSLIRSQSYADDTTPILMVQVLKGATSTTIIDGSPVIAYNDDRNDAIGQFTRFHSANFVVPTYGLQTEDGSHWTGSSAQKVGERAGDIICGIGQGNNYSPLESNKYRKRPQITTNTSAVPYDTGQRESLFWARSATAVSATLDPLDWDFYAKTDVANLGTTGQGNFTISPGVGGSRIFDIGGTLNPGTLVLPPGTKLTLECVPDSAPGTAKAWQVVP